MALKSRFSFIFLSLFFLVSQAFAEIAVDDQKVNELIEKYKPVYCSKNETEFVKHDPTAQYTYQYEVRLANTPTFDPKPSKWFITFLGYTNPATQLEIVQHTYSTGVPTQTTNIANRKQMGDEQFGPLSQGKNPSVANSNLQSSTVVGTYPLREMDERLRVTTPTGDVNLKFKLYTAMMDVKVQNSGLLWNNYAMAPVYFAEISVNDQYLLNNAQASSSQSTNVAYDNLNQPKPPVAPSFRRYLD